MSHSVFRNVALLGATGNQGSKIAQALKVAGYIVTAVQRKGSKNPVPAGIKSSQADLTNKTDLVTAFRGQDVVISSVPLPKYDDQVTLIEAAIEAGVKRIVPSEFSSNLEAKTKEVKLPIVADKLRVREYLEEVAKAGKIEWTSINNGPFFDLGISYGFLGPDLRTKKAVFHDGGDKLVCTTSTYDIADAVVKSLQHPEETRNKPVYIYSALISERQITDLVSKITGIKFEIEHADTEKDADEYLAKLEKGQAPHSFALYFRMMYSEGYGGDYRYLAMNDKIGLRVMNEEQIEEALRSWIADLGFPTK